MATLTGGKKPLEEQCPRTCGLVGVGKCANFLSGVNATTSRDVASATMAHLLLRNGGTCCRFLHRFDHLLIDQLEATLAREQVDCYS